MYIPFVTIFRSQCLSKFPVGHLSPSRFALVRVSFVPYGNMLSVIKRSFTQANVILLRILLLLLLVVVVVVAAVVVAAVVVVVMCFKEMLAQNMNNYSKVLDSHIKYS